MTNKMIQKSRGKENPDLEFIAYALGPDAGPFSDENVNNYPRRIMGAYFQTFSACEKRAPNFENYDAIIVMDREGRIPYYGMNSYCKKNNQPVPDKNKVFFIKTTGMEFLYDDALMKAVSKSDSKLVQSAYKQNLLGEDIWGHFHYEGREAMTPSELMKLCPNEDSELFTHVLLNRNLEWEKKEFEKGETDVDNAEILSAEFTRALKFPIEQRYQVSKKARHRGCGVEHRVEQIEKELLPKVSNYYVDAMNLIKTSPEGTQFHNQLEKIASNEKPKILLVDASSCDGDQKAATRNFLKDVYGSHLDVDVYTTTHELYSSRCETPLIIMRKFLGVIPSNILTIDGFKIGHKENNQDVWKEGFMEGDKIGAELQDNFVSGIKSIGEHLANDSDRFENIKSREEFQEKFKNYLISNPNLVDTLKEVDKVAKDFEKKQI